MSQARSTNPLRSDAASGLRFAVVVSRFNETLTDRLRQGAAYRRLGRALGLARRDRRLVWHVAREARLPCPASLLISAGCFDHAARRSISRPGRSQRLAAIRRRVFESG